MRSLSPAARQAGAAREFARTARHWRGQKIIMMTNVMSRSRTSLHGIRATPRMEKSVLK